MWICFEKRKSLHKWKLVWSHKIFSPLYDWRTLAMQSISWLVRLLERRNGTVHVSILQNTWREVSAQLVSVLQAKYCTISQKFYLEKFHGMSHFCPTAKIFGSEQVNFPVLVSIYIFYSLSDFCSVSPYTTCGGNCAELSLCMLSKNKCYFTIRILYMWRVWHTFNVLCVVTVMTPTPATTIRITGDVSREKSFEWRLSWRELHGRARELTDSRFLRSRGHLAGVSHLRSACSEKNGFFLIGFQKEIWKANGLSDCSVKPRPRMQWDVVRRTLDWTLAFLPARFMILDKFPPLDMRNADPGFMCPSASGIQPPHRTRASC